MMGVVARPQAASTEHPRTPLGEGTNKPPAKRQRQVAPNQPTLPHQTKIQASVPGQKPNPKPKPKNRRRSKKNAPSAGLGSLPAEIIGRIASYLLPPAINVTDGFLPPGELPYSDKRSKWVGAKVKRHPYGAIPSGVRDVLNLALTCKHCDRGVALVIGKIGNGVSDGKKRTMYISIPGEGERVDPVRQRFVNESKMKKIVDRITSSSDVLESLIFHQCSHGDLDHILPARIDPFQSNATSFPKLEHLQLGPNLCYSCTAAILHLFVGQKFTRQPRYSIYTGEREEEPEDSEEDVNYLNHREAIWAPHGTIPRMPSWNTVAAAELKSRVAEYEVSAAPNLVSLQLFISDQKGMISGSDCDMLNQLFKVMPNPSSIQMFQLYLRDNSRWGGMGSSGTVTSHVAKDAKVVEEELTEWAKKEQEKNMTSQERLLAKIQADAAKLIPAAAKRRKVALAAAENDKMVIDLDGDHEKDDSPEGVDVKQEMADVDAELKYEFGSEDESMTPSTSAAPKEPGMTNSERHALYSHRWTARQCRPVLQDIARAMPNLVGLSVLRKGTLLPEITEGCRPIDRDAETWVEPLAKLHSLRYLDLGLAISGAKEVTDFPLGLSITQSRKGRESAKATGADLQALKRRKYELDIKKAIEEGDKWRLQVLRKFLLPKLPAVDAATSVDPVSLADAEATSGPDVEHDDEGSMITWPESLKSGYVYSADLADRLRGNGLAIPWTIVGRTVKLGVPKKIKL